MNRHCTQPQLTATWVAHQVAAGWRLVPIYLGLQAPCTTSGKRYLIDPARARTQGRSEADTAVNAARALGLPRESTLFFDMEAYATTNPTCTTAVLSFLGAWTTRLHDLGYLSGVYGSLGSTVRDLVRDYGSTRRPHPDYLYYARYDGRASAVDPGIPASMWSPHRRIHQYLGGHDETFGGATINIDRDYLDVRQLPRTAFGDFTGNGWSDLLSLDTAGVLSVHPGTGSGLERGIALRGGWRGRDSISRVGDFNGDGHEDVIARGSSTGQLWLYPGTGSGFRPRILLGSRWGGMREITAVGDLNGDRHPDLVAVRQSTGRLYFYPGLGTRLGRRVALGLGWNAMSELTGIGDLTGDGHADLFARRTSTGVLYLRPGRGVGFGRGVDLGAGWSRRRDLVGVGDVDRDGHPDLMAVDSPTGVLRLYRGRTGSLTGGVALPGVWTSRAPLL